MAEPVTFTDHAGNAVTVTAAQWDRIYSRDDRNTRHTTDKPAAKRSARKRAKEDDPDGES